MSANFVGYLLVISVSGCSACFLFRFPFSMIFFRSSLPVWMFSICSLCKFIAAQILSLSYPHSLPPFFLFFCLSFDCQMKEVVYHDRKRQTGYRAAQIFHYFSDPQQRCQRRFAQGSFQAGRRQIIHHFFRN